MLFCNNNGCQIKNKNKLSGQYFQADSFVSPISPSQYLPPLQIDWSCSTRILTLTLRRKYSTQNASCHYWWLKNSVFGSTFKESLSNCYGMLWHPFHRSCRSVRNNMVVSYTLPYSNRNDSHELSGHGIYVWVLIQCFHFALKCPSISKTRHVSGSSWLANTWIAT